jgi:hypothetical protein
MTMANLTFQSVLATGSREIGDAKGPKGAGMFDLFFDNIDLPGFVDHPALLLLATKNVVLDKNFITINAPPEVTRQSFEEASNAAHFVWRVLPNPSDIWILQVHQIPAGRLKATDNVLGIHTRNEKGQPARVRDNFAVARVFLVYSASE